MEDLVEVLQRERDLLEKLRFRFVGLELMLAAGEVRFLDWAVHDVLLARLRARETDLVRAATVGALRLKTIHATPSLREVAAIAPAPWAGMLRDHHDGLSQVVAEVEERSHRIAHACREGMAELARTGHLLPAAVAVAAGGGSPIEVTTDRVEISALMGSAAIPAELDPIAIERVLGDVLTSASRLRMPALVAFLR